MIHTKLLLMIIFIPRHGQIAWPLGIFQNIMDMYGMSTMDILSMITVE